VNENNTKGMLRAFKEELDYDAGKVAGRNSSGHE
jgi:hypothetical protein